MFSLRFAELDLPGLEHIFTLRNPALGLKNSGVESLTSAGFSCDLLVEAEQPHGNRIAQAGLEHAGQSLPLVDGLITNQKGLTLAIRTADCGPLFLYDPEHEAIGVVHSGKKGTEAGILPSAVEALRQAYGTEPSRLIVVLAPCIRPPHYDVDFAQAIRVQASDSGILHYRDSGLNTGADLLRFHSYRMEKGQTGRHYAAIRLIPR